MDRIYIYIYIYIGKGKTKNEAVILDSFLDGHVLIKARKIFKDVEIIVLRH